MPPVGSEVLPSNIFRVVPESADLRSGPTLASEALSFTSELLRGPLSHLSSRVSGVPQGVSEVLSRSSGGVDHFNGQTRVTLSLSGFIGPVRLRNLLPHHHVEPGAGLVAEHEACIVVVPLCVDEEGSTEVHGVELVVP